MRAAALALVALALAGCVPQGPGEDAAAPAGCTVARVVDGDTVDLRCPDSGKGRERTRLLGLDAPEVFSPGCEAELRHGRSATAHLRRLVRDGDRFEVRRSGYDRYGRLLAQLRIDGRDVARSMIDAGLAVPYHGGPRIRWCDRLHA